MAKAGAAITAITAAVRAATASPISSRLMKRYLLLYPPSPPDPPPKKGLAQKHLPIAWDPPLGGPFRGLADPAREEETAFRAGRYRGCETHAPYPSSSGPGGRGLAGEGDYPGRSRGVRSAELGLGTWLKALVSRPSRHSSRIRPEAKMHRNNGATPPPLACPPPEGENPPYASGVVGRGVVGSSSGVVLPRGSEPSVAGPEESPEGKTEGKPEREPERELETLAAMPPSFWAALPSAAP